MYKMNKRIRELMAEADRKCSETRGVYDEILAELIVGECGVALSPMLRDMVSRGQAYDLIKQHFGVTE